MSEIKFVENLTVPCNLKAEPGWKMLVKQGNEVKAIDVVGWQLVPTAIDVGGIFGFGNTQIVLRCNPLISSEFSSAEFLGRVFGPSATSEEITKSIETWQKIYTR
jgi:hypothetical protein